MIQAVGMQSQAMYKGYRKAKVAQWVDLRPLVEVCTRETRYEGGGSKLWPW